MNVRIGLIGAGRMGQVFAHHLAYGVAEADFVAVADQDACLARETAARLGAEVGYADYHELLARQDIDAAVIATPTHTHVEVVIAAAQAGKHIFSEKPLALTAGGLRNGHRRSPGSWGEISSWIYAPLRPRICYG